MGEVVGQEKDGGRISITHVGSGWQENDRWGEGEVLTL